jgi:hypothetical protein
MSSKIKDKKEQPLYYALTPIEDLIEDGISFDGESEKDRLVNQFDFVGLRDIFTRLNAQLSPDQRETLVRYMKLCVKESA